MAAAATDKFQEVGTPGTATTLSAPGYTTGVSTTITVASTTNWPTATGVSFAIDRVDSSGVQIAGTYCEFVGVVASATSITGVTKTTGTSQSYAAGATTRVYIPVSSTRENRIAQGMVVQHKQDGTHADTITTNTINENTAANGVTVDGLNIKDNKLNTNDSVIFSNLLSTLFGGQVTTYTNPGSAGGTSTFFYINLKGIKLFWGETNAISTSGAAPASATGIITLPVGFFTTVQSVTHSVGIASASQYISSALTAKSASAITVQVNSWNGSNGGAPISVFVVGT